MDMPSIERKNRVGVVLAAIVFMFCVIVWISEYSQTKEKADRLSNLEAKVIDIQCKLQQLESYLVQGIDNGE